MKYVVVSHIEGQVTISADTIGEIHDPKNNKLIATSPLFRSLFYSSLHKVVISPVGKTIVSGVFFENLLRDFIANINKILTPLDIKDLQSCFYSYVKRNWPKMLTSIMREQHLIFVKMEKGEILVDRMLFEDVEGCLQRSDTEITVVKVGQKFLLDSGGGACIDTRKSDEEVFSNLLGRKKSPLPFSSLCLSLSGEIRKVESFYDHHRFYHFDDFVTAIERGQFGVTFHNQYGFLDIRRVLNDSEGRNLDLKVGYERFLDYDKFLNLCRSRVPTSNLKFFEFYRVTYQFINEISREDKLFSYKLRQVIKDGVIFMMEEVAENSSELAYFMPGPKIIFMNINIMLKYPFSQQKRIFKHEVEHAFQAAIHYPRWLKLSTNDTDQRIIARRSKHGLPFFPYTEGEATKFNLLVGKGRSRIANMLTIINQHELILDEELLRVLRIFKENVSKYEPCVFPEERVIQRNLDGNSRSGISSLGELKAPFTVLRNELLKVEGEVKVILNYNQIADPALGFLMNVWDVLTKFSNDLPEIQARIIGELPAPLLALFFPEMVQYQISDVADAIGHTPEEFSFITRHFDGAFSRQLASSDISTQVGFLILFRKASDLVPEKSKNHFSAVLAMLARKECSRALRTLCNSGNDSLIVKVITLILELNKKYSLFDIDEIKGGKSALHYAAKKKYRNIYDLLIIHGADPKIADSDGRTAYSYMNKEKQETLLSPRTAERVSKLNKIVSTFLKANKLEPVDIKVKHSKVYIFRNHRVGFWVMPESSDPKLGEAMVEVLEQEGYTSQSLKSSLSEKEKVFVDLGPMSKSPG